MSRTIPSDGRPKGRLYEGRTDTALDGSRVTHFDGPGGVTYQRFTRNGETWWQSSERLCGLRDIDAARKVVASSPKGGGL